MATETANVVYLTDPTKDTNNKILPKTVSTAIAHTRTIPADETTSGGDELFTHTASYFIEHDYNVTKALRKGLKSLTGMVAYFYRLTAPDGWVVCDGASGIYNDTPLYDLFISLGSSYYATEWKTGGKALVYDAENDCFLLDLVGNKIGNSNNTEYVGLFLRSIRSISFLGQTENDGIRKIMGQAAMMIHSDESYQGAFETVDTGSSDGNSGSTRGTRGILYFDSNGGTAATNPMKGHGTANDIHPTNIQLLPCIYTGAIV